MKVNMFQLVEHFVLCTKNSSATSSQLNLVHNLQDATDGKSKILKAACVTFILLSGRLRTPGDERKI